MKGKDSERWTREDGRRMCQCVNRQHTITTCYSEAKEQQKMANKPNAKQSDFSQLVVQHTRDVHHDIGVFAGQKDTNCNPSLVEASKDPSSSSLSTIWKENRENSGS
uniref:Uncharacterized protein n=1 Tax=Anthoceros agrestis TaxID=41834 RepID=A0A6M8B0D0_9EMBR|nr:hypothetical protein [Anthoceros agrestis]QKD76621.1 hypothetical protein [Anthoceros agrestis]